MGPKRSGRHGLPLKNSPSRTRTYDSAVNSRVLYRLSYRGIIVAVQIIIQQNRQFFKHFFN